MAYPLGIALIRAVSAVSDIFASIRGETERSVRAVARGNGR